VAEKSAGNAPPSGRGAPRSGDRPPPSGRTVAARVLERVDKDAAFAAAALDAELSRTPSLDVRERGLATEIVYGVLRTRSALLSRLARHASRGLPDAVARAHLLVAAYQILLLDRVPAHAAVDAAVTNLRLLRGPKVAGFANAVLRKLSAENEPLSRNTAIRQSAAPWLFEALEGAVGADEAEALFGAREAHDEGRTAIRVVESAAAPAWLEGLPRGVVSPRSRLLPREGDPRRREGYDSGAFVLQEEGAQAVALALGARPGDSVLDACAGRGQKTSLLREQIGDGARLWATDLYPDKLAALRTEFTRLRLNAPEVAAIDWNVGEGPVPGGFDRVLVDAPCTGTGTLRHRPEIGLRLQPEDPARLGALAEAILRRASARGKSGARVVFAVCSVLPAECEAVVARVADILEPAPFDATELSGIVAADATSFRLTPLRHGTDGFFVAAFVRR
jgi:16S rRNA (cytosine967-C5)-methyltransferase